jgi:hypothetical protein
MEVWGSRAAGTAPSPSVGGNGAKADGATLMAHGGMAMGAQPGGGAVYIGGGGGGCGA